MIGHILLLGAVFLACYAAISAFGSLIVNSKETKDVEERHYSGWI